MNGAWAKCIMLLLCRLYSWTKSKFTMIRSYFTAAVPGLIVSDVNFNFSCFVHNNRFCFLQVWCSTAFASSGHNVLLKLGLQDTVSYKVTKNCAALKTTHTYTYTRTHTHTHTHTNTHTHTHPREGAHTCIYLCVHAYKYTVQAWYVQGPHDNQTAWTYLKLK